MENLDLNKEIGATLFIIKKNKWFFYKNVGLFIMMFFGAINDFERVKSSIGLTLGMKIIAVIGFLLAMWLVYGLEEIRKESKEHSVIISKNRFVLKKSNDKQVKEIDFWIYRLKSVSIQKNGEVIILSEEELPWGNRKVILSDEFIDRKDEVLNILKSYIC